VAAPAPAGAPGAPPVELQDPSLVYLNKLEDTKTMRNVFMPSAAMIMHYKERQEKQRKEVEQAPPPEPGPPAPDPRKVFAAAHNLEGTFNGPDGSLAVVDGELLRIGDELDGFVLINILPYAAEFYRGIEQVTLEIPLPKIGEEKKKSKVESRKSK
jgi:hypothetical protein